VEPLPTADDPSGIGKRRIRFCDFGVVINSVARHTGAQPQSFGGRIAQLHQFGDLLNINDQVRLAQPFPQLDEDIRASSQHAGLTVGFGEQPGGLGKASRRGVCKVLHAVRSLSSQVFRSRDYIRVTVEREWYRGVRNWHWRNSPLYLYLQNQIWKTKRRTMARPAAAELTQRELEVMHAFWKRGELTAIQARDLLATQGIDRAYVTVANLVRILVDKGFLEQTNADRPFQYRPIRAFHDVSRSLVRDLVERVFRGSREELLVQILGQKRLTAKERAMLEQILKEQER
jgi:predicted transcriptional regulator